MVAAIQRARSASQIDVPPAAVADIRDVLARHNPGLSKKALAAAGEVMAAVSAIAAQLSAEQQRRLVADKTGLARALTAAVAEVATPPGGSALAEVSVVKPVEVSEGAGMASPLTIEEGRRNLAAFAVPVRLEDWAGPVAGPGDIEKRFGTKRSTLHAWRKSGAVIGLLKGERKHVFPLAQFVDGRPVEGMPQVTKTIRNSRAAWQWLIQTKPGLGGTPLDRLKAGRLDEVLAAAERDFG